MGLLTTIRSNRSVVAYGNWTGDPSGPASSVGQTLPRLGPNYNAAAPVTLTSGILHLTGVVLRGGATATALNFVSGSTAAVTPTNWWFALYTSALALVAQTPDQTTAAWAANTTKTVSFSTPQTVPATGLYYVGVMMAAATPVTLTGIAPGTNNVAAIPSALHGTSTTGLTTTAPSTAAALTVAGGIPYAWVT